MMNSMEYNGYTGSVEFSAEDNLLYGKVQGIRSLISYQGESVSELVRDFHEAVDEYLSFCSENGNQPEKPYSGNINITISPEIYKKALIYAERHNQSFDEVVEGAIARAIR